MATRYARRAKSTQAPMGPWVQKLAVGSPEALNSMALVPIPGADGVYVQVGGSNRGGWVIKLNSGSEESLATYDRVELVPVPQAEGVFVRVGIANRGHRNLIDVFLPRALGGADEAGSEALAWVQAHWHDIWNAGKGQLQPSTTSTPANELGTLSTLPAGMGQVPELASPTPAPGGAPVEAYLPKRWQRYAKFVLTPEKATQRIGYGIAYMPWEVDLQGQYATEEEVAQMAHKFMARLQADDHAERSKIGEMHARWELPNGERPGIVVESFQAFDHPIFPEGAWIVGVKFAESTWKRIESGELTGFSIGGDWGRRVLRMQSAEVFWQDLEQAA